MLVSERNRILPRGTSVVVVVVDEVTAVVFLPPDLVALAASPLLETFDESILHTYCCFELLN